MLCQWSIGEACSLFSLGSWRVGGGGVRACVPACMHACMHTYSSLQSLCLALQRNLRHCLLPELTSSLPLQSGRIQWEKVSPAAGKREGCVCRRKRSLLLPSNCERKLANQMERAQTALLLHRFLPRPTQHTHTYAHTLAFGRFIPKPDPQTA